MARLEDYNFLLGPGNVRVTFQWRTVKLGGGGEQRELLDTEFNKLERPTSAGHAI